MNDKGYANACSLAAQAIWDRWPDRYGCIKAAKIIGRELGKTEAEVDADIKKAPCERDGGRW